MKAAQINAYGGKDVVQITNDAERPKPAADQLLVRVGAAGVNPFDNAVREGHARQMAELTFPATLGADVAGVVAEIGEDVSGFKVGDEIYGQASALSGQGSFAEFVPLKAASAAAKPTSLKFTAAAALPLAASSAYQALIDDLQLQPDQKILIHGGAGGIGSLAIQIAKHVGAYVATTASAEDAAFAKQLGADEVIDYKSQDFATLLEDYDAVFDTVGGDTNRKSYDVLKHGGKLVSMVAPADKALATEKSITYSHQYTQVTTTRLVEIARLVDQEILSVVIDKVFPLDQAAEALEYLRTGHPRGKVVIQVSAD